MIFLLDLCINCFRIQGSDGFCDRKLIVPKEVNLQLCIDKVTIRVEVKVKEIMRIILVGVFILFVHAEHDTFSVFVCQSIHVSNRVVPLEGSQPRLYAIIEGQIILSPLDIGICLPPFSFIAITNTVYSHIGNSERVLLAIYDIYRLRINILNNQPISVILIVI